MSKPVLQAFGMTLHRHSFGEAGWVLLGQVGAALGSLVGLKLLTQLLPKEIFGQVNLITVAMILPSWVLFSPFLQAVARLYAPSRESGKLNTLLRTTIWLYFWMSLLVMVGGTGLLLSGFLKNIGIPSVALALALGVLVADNWQLLGAGVYSAARQRRQVATFFTLLNWTRPFCVALFLILFGVSLTCVMSGYLVVSLALLPFALRPLMVAIGARDGEIWLDRPILDRMIAYGAPYAVWSAFAWAQSYVDRYILEWHLGTPAVGPYAAAYQVATLPFVFASGFFGQFITPIVFERAGSGTHPERLESGEAVVRSSLWLFAGLGIAGVGVYAAWGGPILSFLTHPDYLVPSGILAILAAGTVVECLGQLLGTSLLAKNRPDLLLWAFLLPGILSVPISWLFVRQFGTWGAAWANAMISFLFLAMVGWTLKMEEGK